MATYNELIELGQASEVSDEVLCFNPRGKVYRLSVEVHRSLLFADDVPSNYVGLAFPFRNEKNFRIIWHFTDLEDLILESAF